MKHLFMAMLEILNFSIAEVEFVDQFKYILVCIFLLKIICDHFFTLRQGKSE